MPVFDYSRTPIKNLPDQICIVLHPQRNPEGTAQEHQSGSLTIDTHGIVGYLPIFRNYQEALQEYPNSHIYVMDLTEYKKELGLIPTNRPK